MSPPFEKPPFTWRRKFGYAFRGIAVGVRGERSFIVHLAAAPAVIVAAGPLGCTVLEWCVLFFAVGGVLSAELFNRAIERLANAITSEEEASIRDALDIAAGAVLIASATSAAVGLAVFGHRVWLLSLA
jgi:diacylglycerol kinase